MAYAFQQGYLDCLCGIYSIVNAEKVINNSSFEESQSLFNSIIKYLADKGELEGIVTGGVYTSNILNIIKELPVKRVSLFKNKKKFSGIDSWWDYSVMFIKYNPNSAIILSIGGRQDHVTVVKSMTGRAMTLLDSGGIKIIRKTSCDIKGYEGADKFVIYPYQNLYLVKES